MSEYFIDYEKVLADLESKRDALNGAIEGIRKLLFANAQALPDGTLRQGVTQITNGQDIPTDAFFGLSIREAIKKYLSIMKKPQSYRDIADALEAGGFVHSSKKFYSTINTTLGRMAEGEGAEVVKVKGEWGLVEWYPGLKRARLPRKEDDESARQSSTEETGDDERAMNEDASPEQPSLPTETEQPSLQSQNAA